MKLGILVQHYFPYGGLQRDACRLALAAQARGHAATLVVSTTEGSLPNGIEMVKLNSGGSQNHSRLARFSHECRQLKQFDTTIAFSRIHGVPFHFCGDPCYRESFLCHKPHLLAFLPRYRFLLENERLLFGTDSITHLFFLAPTEIPPFQKHYHFPKERFTVLPPWLSPPQEIHGDDARHSVRSEFGIAETAACFLFVGSDFQRKGLDRAIRVCARLEAHLIVCGADDTGPMERLTLELGSSPRVHFAGPRDDIPRLMSGCSALLHPARQETAGMVLIEALTYALPVLSTQVCGYASHVADAGCPLLSAEPTIDEMATKLNLLIEQRDAIVEKIIAWRDQPGRDDTASVILTKIEHSLS